MPNNMSRHEFGRWLKVLRVKKCLTQENLAQLAGLSTQHYNKIETGVTGTRRATVQRLAVALEVEVAEAYKRAGLQDPGPGDNSSVSRADDVKRFPLNTNGRKPLQSDITRGSEDAEHIARQLSEAVSTHFKGEAGLLVERFTNQLNVLVLEAVQVHLKEYIEEVRALASKDVLTDLNNEVAFDQVLWREFDLSRRHQVPVSVLLIDVDHFELYNVEHGHVEGDRLLRNLADTLKEKARRTDTVARFGGGTFGIILPHTYGDAAETLARRYRSNIKKEPWNERGLTVSIGVAVTTPAMGDQSDLTWAAEEALRQAKQNGRDKAVLHKS